jgi:hypothetical protein
MPCIGRIESGSGTNEINESQWIALIKTEASLAPIPPRKGINPFTRKATEFRAPATSATILKDRVDIGTIYWAMDGSSMLMVDAREGSEQSVISVAEEVATKLGARFVCE